MIKLSPFQPADFDRLISWIDSKELLIQIAGPYFSYPLTIPQLQNYLEDKKSISFNIIDGSDEQTIGHAEIILVDDNHCKIDKLILGEKTSRGKGFCGLVINELLKYCFENLNAIEVELNVFDWNVAAMKCYERSGFTYDKNKTLSLKVEEVNWTALNMSIGRNEWINSGSGGSKNIEVSGT